MDQFLEKIGGIDEGAELVKFFNAHSKTLSDEAGDNRKKKNLAKAEATEFEDAMKELLSKINAKDKDDAIGKISATDAELKEIREQVKTITDSLTKTEKEKESALLLSEITEAISNKKVSDKNGILKDAMISRAIKGDSGYLIGEQTPSEFLQSQIDSEEPMFKAKDKIETPPKGGDVYTVEELESLSDSEMDNNKSKVERSMSALR